MTLDLDTKALSVLLAGLRALDEKWTAEAAATDDEDEAADLTNDLLFARSLRSDLERRATGGPAGHGASASAA